MLSPDELFPLYAELARGLAGFAGVAAAFAGRDRVFRPTERIRFLAVVANSGCVLTGCFVVFAAWAWGSSESVAWRLAGFACLCFAAVIFLGMFPQAWRAARDPDSTTESWALLVSAGTNLILAISYAGAAFSSLGSFCLVLGFSVHLLHGLWMFVRILTRAN